METVGLVELRVATKYSAERGKPPRWARARWEGRSMSRGLGAGRSPVLARSRGFVQGAGDLIDEAGLESLAVSSVLDRTRLSRRAFWATRAEDAAAALREFCLRAVRAEPDRSSGR
jgi:hypothetical protein